MPFLQEVGVDMVDLSELNKTELGKFFDENQVDITLQLHLGVIGVSSSLRDQTRAPR